MGKRYTIDNYLRDTEFSARTLIEAAEDKEVLVRTRSDWLEVKSSHSGKDKEGYIFRNLNLTIERGSTIAIVGPSGIGKSTLINLLLSNFFPQENQIFINNRNMCEINPNIIRENIGVVLQNTYLFNDTIYNNILFGNPNATKEEVLFASKLANVDSFVQKLPDKYNTVIGESGDKLSRGQGQRIAIARMVLKKPSIVILDEATASLDNQNEQSIHNTLKKFMEGKTTIIISHKLESLHYVDKILFISNGQIVEEGSHEDLLKAKGAYYYEMYGIQKEEKVFL